MNYEYLADLVDRYTEAMHLVAHSTRNTGSPLAACIICDCEHPEESETWVRPHDCAEDLCTVNEEETWVCSESCAASWVQEYREEIQEWEKGNGGS